jgi:osmotically-inducible protein OsmY
LAAKLKEIPMNNDKHLQQAVIDELSWEPSLNAAHIGVAAQDGVVTLTGHVAAYAEKHAAETAALRIKGVMAVAEEMTVDLSYETKRTDAEIASAVIDRLGWNVSIPKDGVKVKVESGWVTLSGDVTWQFQKEAAQHDVRYLYGVVGVSNLIHLKPRVNVNNLSDDITHALHRSYLFGSRTVNVTANGGEVRLSGTVHTVQERQDAARTAWAAPGVTTVENDLAVVL